MSSHSVRTDAGLSFGLAFVGGYGDAAGFVLANTFTGHITGSLVLAAISIAAHDWRATVARLSAVVSFLAGILLSVLLARLLAARPSWPLLPTAIGVEVVLIISGYLALTSHVASGTEIFVICLSLALGLQNGAFRRAGGVSVHTTYLTGMITGLMVMQAEEFVDQGPERPAVLPAVRVRLLYGIWVAFFLGAATGAALVLRFKEAGMLGAVLVLFVIIVRNLIAAPPAHLAG
jgi:uncharacterized membrane protein YoaK (UPF0700 family)